MALESGTRLGHYEITEQIGKGGMGEVYRARDTKLGREVAIKVLPSEFAQDTERLARLEREARMLAALNHPNVAAIYGLEQSDETRFLVLELVEGDTLADVLKRGSIPVAESLKLSLQIAEALEAAHEKGVIHRDLKPANIKVTPEGRVKVLDFGLAKAFVGSASDANLSNSPTLSMPATQAGIILGTAAYMSPEQAKGVTADRRADVFSFGCVLFEMLTGRMAFRGGLVSEILASVINQEPDYTALPENLHPRIRELLRRCFEKQLRGRWQAVGDLRAEIEQVLADPAGVSVLSDLRGSSVSRRALLGWSASALGLAGAAGIAGWMIKPAPSPEGAVVQFFHPLGDENFSRTGRPMVGISRDGTRLAYVATRQLWLRDLSELADAARPILGTEENPSTPVFSPDGETLVYWSDGGLKQIPAGGGTPIDVAPAPQPFGVSWGDDGRIVYALSDGIWSVAATGGTPERIVEAAQGEQFYGPSILPGGTQILYALSEPGSQPTLAQWDEAEIIVEDLDTHGRTIVWAGGNDVRYLPTGHLVYAFENDLFVLRFDLDSLTVDGGQVSMVNGVRRASVGQTGTANYAVSEQGTLVYIPGIRGVGATRRIVFMNRDFSRDVLPVQAMQYERVRLSPAGDRIVTEILADDGTRQIWIYSIERDVLDYLTLGERPVWTPDGTEITFLNDGRLWNIRSDFTADAEELRGTDLPGNRGPSSWSTNREVLLFSDGNTIYSWTRGSEEEAELTVITEGIVPVFSPDGLWFVYEMTGQLYALPFPVGTAVPQTVTTEGGSMPIWPRSSGELFFVRAGGVPVVRAIEITTQAAFGRSRPVDVLPLTSAVLGGLAGNVAYDATADGQRILYTAPEATATEEDLDESGRINVVLNWFHELKDRAPMS